MNKIKSKIYNDDRLTKNEKVELIKITNFLKAQFKSVMENDYTDQEKLERADVLLNMTKIIENYKNLEPLHKEFLAEQHYKEKFKIKHIEEMEK